jgi:excisionase family DNA binding protein
MITNTRPLVLTVTEAGLLLGVSRSTAYELVRTGDLESVRLRRRVVVPTRAIAKHLGIELPDVWQSWLGLTRDDPRQRSDSGEDVRTEQALSTRTSALCPRAWGRANVVHRPRHSTP